MRAARNGRADQSLGHRKSRDRALILPLVGLILLMPPLAGIFQLDAMIAGVPLTVVYLFAVWALLIAGAFALSRSLRDDGDQPAADDDTRDAGGQGGTGD